MMKRQSILEALISYVMDNTKILGACERNSN